MMMFSLNNEVFAKEKLTTWGLENKSERKKKESEISHLILNIVLKFEYAHWNSNLKWNLPYGPRMHCPNNCFDFRLRPGICGSFFLSFSRSKVVTNKSSNDTLFCSKRGIGWKNNHFRVKYGNVFTQIMMFSLKKIDDLRAREQKREEKRNHKFRTKFCRWRYRNISWNVSLSSMSGSSKPMVSIQVRFS